MKYFIDTEFIEGFHKPLFGKKRHFVDLISIGIVAEDGREYYAISNEYRYNDASQWVKDNVILPMYQNELSGDIKNRLTSKNFHKEIGKSNRQIAMEIETFCNTGSANCINGIGCCNYFFDKVEDWKSEFAERKANGHEMTNIFEKNPLEFYAYYADYDWVVFCSLFGTMMDLPKGFPMYCNDLKQAFDEKVTIHVDREHLKGNMVKFDEMLGMYKSNEAYPKQENEHNALADAKWNKKLHEFLKSI